VRKEKRDYPEQQGESLRACLDISEDEWLRALGEKGVNYIRRVEPDRRSGKPRHLCHPPRNSALFRVQAAIKRKILEKISLAGEIRGYRRGSHNILVAAEVSGSVYCGKIDISNFHPSITKGHVAAALSKHGVPSSWARLIAELATYENTVPQGAPTSNHIANIVLDSIMQRRILPLARTQKVEVRNYGDDIAFYGPAASAVRACVLGTKRLLKKEGFQVNHKCSECEHRGEKRLFIGCATGRQRPDYPRDKYCSFRKELRQLVRAELSRGSSPPLTSKSDIKSLAHRIGYVARLNRRKARRLWALYHRLCAARRGAATLAA